MGVSKYNVAAMDRTSFVSRACRLIANGATPAWPGGREAREWTLEARRSVRSDNDYTAFTVPIPARAALG